MKYDVVAVSWPAVDVTVPVENLPVLPGETQIAASMTPEPGAVGNFLIVASRLGLRVSPIGVIGDDSFGNFLANTYRREGIDTSQLIMAPYVATPTVIVLADGSGQHSFISTAQYQVASFLDTWKQAITDCRSLMVSGYLLMSPEPTPDITLDIARFARSHGVPVFFDPGPMIASMPKGKLEELISLSTTVIANIDEAEMLTATRDPELATERLFGPGHEYIVVKLGPDGCVVGDGANCTHFPGFSVPTRDTTGAGDSFAAAFMYGYLSGWSIKDTVTLANATGAAKARKFGSGTKVPTVQEIRGILAGSAVAAPVLI